MWDIVKAFRRPHRFAHCRLACPTGTAVSQGFRAASPVASDAGASPRHALLAESPGKPSLWVFINAPWYYLGNVSYMLSSRDSATTNRADIIGQFAVTRVVLLFVVAASGPLR